MNVPIVMSVRMTDAGFFSVQVALDVPRLGAASPIETAPAEGEIFSSEWCESRELNRAISHALADLSARVARIPSGSFLFDWDVQDESDSDAP